MILVVGSINIDICLNVAHIPEPGETVLSNGFEKNSGGKGANQAASAAKLGSEVVMLGCIGKDENGLFLLNSLKDAGINTDYIKISESVPTSTAYIAVSDSGENSIIVDSSANYRVSSEYLYENEELFQKADYCILQMEIPAETVKTAIEICKKSNTQIVLNPSPLNGFSNELLYDIDYLVPNKAELLSIMQNGKDDFTDSDIMSFMEKYRIKNLTVTLGAKGCKMYNQCGETIFCPSKRREVVDTTGAGDTFLGALITAISKDMTYDKALKFANTASGIEVTRPGAQKSMPVLQEVLSELNQA